MKQFRNPSDIHPPVSSYTHPIETLGAERLLFISGQIGMHENGSLPDNPIEQLDLAFENPIRDLHAAGMNVLDLVKITFYLVGEMDADKREKVIAVHVQGHKSCMTSMHVAGLAYPAMKVELDAWANQQEKIK